MTSNITQPTGAQRRRWPDKFDSVMAEPDDEEIIIRSL